MISGAQMEKTYNESFISDAGATSNLSTLDEMSKQEKIDQVREFATKGSVKRPNVPSRTLLNTKAKEIQSKLSEQGKYVKWKEIIYKLLEMYHCNLEIGELGLDRVDGLESINELIRLQKRIDSFIMSYESRAACITLHDLEKAICSDYNYSTTNRANQLATNKKDRINKYEELFLGPLIKNQIVRQIFKFPDEINSINQLKPIKLIDLINTLCQYLTEKNIWKEKVNESEFEKYLTEKFSVSTAYTLAYKITNIGLVKGTVKSVQHIYSESMKDIKTTLSADFKEFFANEKDFLFKQLNERLVAYNQQEQLLTLSSLDPETKATKQELIASLKSQVNMRKKHLSSNSADLIAEFMSLFENLVNKSEYNYIKDFLDTLKTSSFLRDCLQLCICLSKNDFDLCLKKINENKKDEKRQFYNKYSNLLKQLFYYIIDVKVPIKTDKEFLKAIGFLNNPLNERNLKIVPISYKKFNEKTEGESSDDEAIQIDDDPNERSKNSNGKTDIQIDYNTMVERLNQFINTKFEPESTIGFEDLARLESELLVNTGQMLFVDFLFKNKSIFEQNGLSLILLDNNNEKKSRPNTSLKIENILKHIKQLKYNFKSNSKSNLNSNDINQKIETILNSYYSIKSIENLGFGNLEHLMEQLNKLDTDLDQQNNKNTTIIYENSIFDYEKNGTHVQNSILNDKEAKVNELIEKLNECPLLENVYNYLNWNQHSPTFGDLKEFLNALNEKNYLNLRIDLIEIEPYSNKLYKLTRDTDIEKLKQSIENGDYINASGNLVSLIAIKYSTLAQTPRSLLINEIESSLSTLLKKSNQSEDEIELVELKNSYFKYYYESINQNLASTVLSFISQEEYFSFLIEFIFRIPLNLLAEILFTYIIDPLIKIDGDHTIKQKLFEYLVISNYLSSPFKHKNINSCVIDDTKINHFIKLGQLCSINEWSKSNYEKIIKIISNKSKKHKIIKNEQNSIESKSKHIETTKSKGNKRIEEKIDTSSDFNEIKEIELKEIEKQVNSNELKENMSNQYNHVKSIRQRYGIGIELNEETKSVTDSLKGVIGRSLESLSNELYNKDMHFVLELIQNADDNNYIKINESNQMYEPTLVFLIEKEKITLFNNETGFTERNINAICDVKVSTKGKHQHGYIGRKGIGFKSVFTITDRPEIHSNDYHINFDLSNGHIGYILPNWISDEDKLNKIESLKEYVYEKININGHNSNLTDLNKIGKLNTCIQLPLKSESEMQRHKSSLLTNNFNDIKPYLLLFLNRLRNLIIIKKQADENDDSDDRLNKNYEFIFHREDLGENLIEIKSNLNDLNNSLKKHKWLVVRESLNVPNNLKPSDDVESTDLCLAFPIDNQNMDEPAENEQVKMNNYIHKPLPKMDVFAYLPLRSFGFSFIIQADFVVPASRQDINQDSDWNQWISKQIPSLFVKSLKTFQEHKDFTCKIESLKAFLRFIPLEEEIVGFFQHIPRQIINLLQNEDFLPAIDSNSQEFDQEERVVWKKPFECIVVKNDDVIKQVLTSDLLKKYLGRYYLDSSILNSSEINPKILYSLGVRNLNLNDILEILKTVFSSFDSLNFKDIKTTAKWLVVLQHCLNNYSLQQERDFIKQLKQLPIIPIIKYENEQVVKDMVSLEKCCVFFPSAINNYTSTQKKDSLADSTKLTKIQCLIEKDLNLLDIDSLLCLDQLKNAQIISLLKSLGVKQQEPKEIIECHILEMFKNKSLNELRSEETIVLYLIYLHDYFQSGSTFNYISFNLDTLKENLLVKTNKGFKNLLTKECIYLTPTYGNKYDLKTILSSYDWCLIDQIYLTKSIELKAELNTQSKATSKSKITKASVDPNQLMLSWRKFFISLGLNDMFVPQRIITKLSNSEFNDKQNEMAMAYLKYEDLLETITNDESYLFTDYSCNIFSFYANIIENTKTEHLSKKLVEELSNLYRIIEENWSQTHFKLSSYKYASVSVVFTNEANTKKNIKSKFNKEEFCESMYYHNLRNKNWILTEKYKFTQKESDITEKKGLSLATITYLEKPYNVFVKEQVFFRIYGFHVPYAINPPHKEKSSFGKDLNFKFEFNMMDFLNVFKTWFILGYGENESNKNLILDDMYDLIDYRDREIKFFASLMQMKNIYLLLANHLNNLYETKNEFFYEISNLIKNNDPILFVPDEENELEESEQEKVLIGSFYSSEKVYWCDPTGLFNRYADTLLDRPILLEPFYYDQNKGEHIKQIFTNDFNVKLTPCLEDYISLLEHIAKQASTNRSLFTYEQTLADVYQLFEFLVELLAEPNNETKLFDLIKDKSVIPCYNNKWISIANNPILVDKDLELAEKFIDKINMVVLPINNKNGSLTFLDLCKADDLNPNIFYFFSVILKLNSFSKVVILDLENITESLREAPKVQNICRKLVPFIQSFMHSRFEFKDLYDYLNSALVNIVEKLKEMKFYSVKELQNIYRSKLDPSICVIVSNKTCLDMNEKNMYWKYFVRADILDSEKDIVKGFVKLFFKTFSDKISSRDEMDLMNFCIYINQLSNFNMSGDDIRDIERDYKIKLLLSNEEMKWNIPEAIMPVVYHNQQNENDEIGRELEEGELVERKSNKFKTNNTGQSKRQKLLEFEKLSSSQINDQQLKLMSLNLTDNRNEQIQNFNSNYNYNQKMNFYNKFLNAPNSSTYNSSSNTSNRSYQEMNRNLEELATKKTNNFNIETINRAHPNVININEDFVDFRLEKWSNEFLTNLNSIEIPIDQGINSIKSKEYLAQIGRWGEFFVYEMLKKNYEDEIGKNLISIEWVNQFKESGLPYDFRIHDLSKKTDFDFDENQNTTMFIEVKSTIKSIQEAFPISYHELTFAHKFSDKFQIYRLYNAGSPNDVKVKIISNISNLLQRHGINLYMII